MICISWARKKRAGLPFLSTDSSLTAARKNLLLPYPAMRPMLPGWVHNSARTSSALSPLQYTVGCFGALVRNAWSYQGITAAYRPPVPMAYPKRNRSVPTTMIPRVRSSKAAHQARFLQVLAGFFDHSRPFGIPWARPKNGEDSLLRVYQQQFRPNNER